MNENSMTALVSCFARAYHYKNRKVHVFKDSIAEKILGECSYNEIKKNMIKGISFFNPDLEGTENEILDWIVDNILAPTPSSRAAFAFKKLENASLLGAKQYLIFASGYDSTPYMNLESTKDMEIFEIDHPNTQRDKLERIKSICNIQEMANIHFIEADFSFDNWESRLNSHPNFSSCSTSFATLLGISYYLKKNDFERMIMKISTLLNEGSSLVLDYFDKNVLEKSSDLSMKKKIEMTKKSDEKIRSSYSYNEIETILSKHGLLIYEHLSEEEINNEYFFEYNNCYPNKKMKGEGGVSLLLAVKKK